MPETTICFDTSTIDLRVEMRGVLAELRTSPLVNSVRHADVPPEQGRQSWVVDHDGLYEYGGTAESRALAARLRRLEVLPRADEDFARRTWDRVYGTPERPDPPSFPDIQRDIIQQAIQSPTGRMSLAASMIAPLRPRLDYTAFGRRSFLVEELPQGALPTYERESPAVETGRAVHDTLEALTRFGTVEPPQPGFQVYEEPGQAVFNLRADRIHIPEFEIAANPTIRLSDIQQRRFDLIRRAPPAPPPPWAGVGVYVRNRKDAEDLWVITEVLTHEVMIERWRGVYRTATVTFSSLTERYEPCLAPAPPLTRFDRNLEV